jgi:methylenetetrahydrofolate--tRNA-(uracil-5-)-methyltransferase
MTGKIYVVGGGLAGCEAAWQVLRAGLPVTLCEMRPETSTPAHRTGSLAELVCSNSMKSMEPHSAPGLLKSEMRTFGSLVLEAAEEARVPAGQALAVDREVFSAAVTRRLEAEPGFTRLAGEIQSLPTPEELAASGDVWIVATGPLTSAAMAKALEGLCPPEARRLFFYDAIAPVIAADSIDMDKCFRASRYGKSADGGEAAPEPGREEGDYLNLPLTKPEYEAFIDALVSAEYMALHEFEDTKYFEACLPVEVMVERGRETLRFGPMKPVGLTDPKTGRWPWAVVQLRQENLDGTMFSMVGFQTKMKWPEQRRVFSMIPALTEAEFLRFGSVHRNTYLLSPKVLGPDLSFRASPRIFLAGQVTGVEGYTESAAIGILAGRAALARVKGETFAMPPKDTMIGALAHYVTFGGLGDFQPMNANLGLLPPAGKRKGESKPERKARQCGEARRAFETFATGGAATPV